MKKQTLNKALEELGIDMEASTIVYKDKWVESWDDLGIRSKQIAVKWGNNTIDKQGRIVSYPIEVYCPQSLLDNLPKYIALQKLIDLRDHVNGDWKPEKIDAFFIGRDNYDNSILIEKSYLHGMLYFKDEETAERFLSTHKELILEVKELL